MNVDHQLRREAAVTIARQAGGLLHPYATRLAAGSDLKVSTKTSVTDPVSNADRASEQHIVNALRTAFPEDQIVAEEGAGYVDGTSGYQWVIDPLDGTVNFLHGIGMWCVSIACIDSEGPVAAVVYHPGFDDMYSAVRDGGTDCNGEPLTVAPDTTLADSLIATGFSYEACVRDVQGRELAELIPAVRDIRRGGAAALDLAFVAAGRVTGYVEMCLQVWDWAAGALLVTEAGGVVRSFRRYTCGRERQLIIAGPKQVAAELYAWQGQQTQLQQTDLVAEVAATANGAEE